MHKLIEYICNELEELERKADKDGKLSMSEIQYGDTLAHMKKNLLKADEMWEDSEYSMAGGSYDDGSYNMGGRRGGSYNMRGGSYARGNRGGGRGRGRGGANQYGSYAMGSDYSRASEDMVAELRELMQEAPDDRTRKEFERFIQKMEQM